MEETASEAIRQNAKRQERMMKDIARYLKERLTIELQRKSNDHRVLRAERIDARHNYFRLLAEEMDIQQDLERIEKNIRSETSFARDFETLLAIEGVRQVSVDGDKIIIRTKRIFQEIENLPSQIQRYDIGQQTITLTIHPAADRRNIGFSQGPYRGFWRHQNATPQNPCFGRELNLLADDLIRELKISALTHLCFSLLRRDMAPPIITGHAGGESEPVYSEEMDRPSAISEEEREKTKAAFVELLMRTAKETLSRNIFAKLADVGRRATEAKKVLSLTIAVCRELELVIREISNEFRLVEQRAAEQTNKLLNNPAFINLSYEQSGALEIFFEFEKERLVLVINKSGGLPRLLATSPKRNGLLKPMVNENGYPEINSNRLIKNIAKFQRHNDLAGILDVIVFLLRCASESKKRRAKTEQESPNEGKD